jgi:plastocyanin
VSRAAAHFVVLVITSCVAATGLSACGSSGGGNTLTIQADYAHDEFAGSLYGFFPNKVTVKPGMTIKFHQTWTGEPHTVTLGTRVTELAAPFRKELGAYFDTGILGAEPPGYDAFNNGLPYFYAEQGAKAVNQTAAQPCSARDVSDLPTDRRACADKTLGSFEGTEAYYNSGFIPFQGSRGNTFELPIAADAKPGTYLYYCNLHGAPMGGEITVTDDGAVSKQSALNRQAKREADRMAEVLLAVYRDEKAGKSRFNGNLAGSGDSRTANVFGKVNEFTPRTIDAKLGEKVTWTFLGHNLSFNVPPYAPIFIVGETGEVAFNNELDKPAGGWPGRTPALSKARGAPAPALVHVDAGAFDGSGGFKSTGTGWATGDTYSITFTKKGTYPYACIVHPGMIGKVVVK